MAESVSSFKVLLKSERALKADLVESRARCEALLTEYKAEVVSSYRAYEQLESQLVTAQTSLRQARDEKTNLAESLRKFKVLLKSERAQKSDLVEGKAQCEVHLKEYAAEVSSSQRAHEQLKRQLVTTQTYLGQERGERKTLAESLRKSKVLLKSERAQRAEIEESKTRCEALLDEQTSRRLLGAGINIQGTYQTLPEIEGSIQKTLMITVSEWLEEGSHGLLDFSKNYKWFIPKLVAHLFTLCKEVVYGFRQQYVNMFMGKVEGALEDSMDPETAQFMRNHLRRHHLTLFSAVGINRDKTCRLIATRLGAIIADFVDSGIVCHNVVNNALAVSGIEEITGQYLRILASCAVQHPAVSFSCDCYRVQSFGKRLHFEPVDGDGDVARGGQCMVIFPALITKQGESLANKRFVLGPQEQG